MGQTWTELTRGTGNVLTITQREVRAFFVSPVAYAVIVAQLAVCTYIMFLILRESSARGFPVYTENPYTGRTDGAGPAILFWLRFSSMLAFPLITMRLFAEERRTGTIEQLLTSPVRDVEVVLGKYFGAVAILAVMLAVSFVYPFWFHKFAKQEWPQMLTGLLSFFGAGCAFLAVGLFVSSLTRSQITAAIATLGALLILWMIGWGARSTEGTAIGKFLEYISLENSTEDLIKGVIDIRAIAYFGSLTLFMLFATVRSLAGHRAQ